jgi:crotonobetainyl-CoA:carnitine CoA-transferase CaiB-like acyl-CoA transferase
MEGRRAPMPQCALVYRSSPFPMQKVLAGKRVLDLTQNVAGPYCTQILGDLGAEVIKIERPGSGDDTRAWTPPDWNGRSPTFLALNRNKQSVCVDLDDPDGARIVARLAHTSDVVVHSMKPGSAASRGLGFERLREGHERLVYCAISAFGNSGPLRDVPGYDPLVQAFTGIMSVTGHDGDPPARVSVSLVDMGTGMWAAMGILAALLEVGRTGRGVEVSASLLETGVGWMTLFVANFQASGTLPRRLGSGMAMIAPYEAFAARDGHVFIAAGNDRLFGRVCSGLGLDALAQDPRFATNPARVRHRVALHERIEEATRELAAAEIVRRLQALGAPCSVLNDVGQMLGHPQVAAAGMVQALPLEPGDGHRVIGLPFSLDGARPADHAPPPALGSATDRLLADAGFTRDDIGTWRRRGAIG